MNDDCIKYLMEHAVGREHAIFGGDLGDLFGLVDSQIRKLVNKARCNGVPICSTNKGYYYSTDPAEITATINGLYHRIESVIHAIDGLEKALMAAENQQPA